MVEMFFLCALMAFSFCIHSNQRSELIVLKDGVVHEGKIKEGEEVDFDFQLPFMNISENDINVAYFRLQISSLFSPKSMKGVEVEMVCGTEKPPGKVKWNATRSFRLLTLEVNNPVKNLYLTIRGKTGNTRYTLVGMHCLTSGCAVGLKIKDGSQLSLEQVGRLKNIQFLEYIPPDIPDYRGIIASVTPISGDTTLTMIASTTGEGDEDGYGETTYTTDKIPNILMIPKSPGMKVSRWEVLIVSQDAQDTISEVPEYELSIQTYDTKGKLVHGISKYSTTTGGGLQNSTFFWVDPADVNLEKKINNKSTTTTVFFSLLVSVYPKTQYNFDCLNIYASQNTTFPNPKNYTWSTFTDSVWEDVMLPLENITMNRSLYVSVTPCSKDSYPMSFMIAFVSKEQPLFIPMQSSDIRPITLQRDLVDLLVLRTYNVPFGNFSMECDSCSNSKFRNGDEEILFQFERLGSSTFENVNISVCDDGFSLKYENSRYTRTLEDYFVRMVLSSEQPNSFSLWATTFLKNHRPVIYLDEIVVDSDDDDDCDDYHCNVNVSVWNGFQFFRNQFQVYHYPPTKKSAKSSYEGDPGLPLDERVNLWTSCSIRTNEKISYDGIMNFDRFHNTMYSNVLLERGKKYVLTVLVIDPVTQLSSVFTPTLFQTSRRPVPPIQCYNKNKDDKAACSGHGACISSDSCSCQSWWFGRECSLSLVQLLAGGVAPALLILCLCVCCLCAICCCICIMIGFCVSCVIPLSSQTKTLKNMKKKLTEYEVKIIMGKNENIMQIDNFGLLSNDTERTPLLSLTEADRKKMLLSDTKKHRFSGKKNGMGKIYEYDPTTRRYFLAFEGEFSDGLKVGKGREYYTPEPTRGPEEGLIRFEGLYHEGKRHGKGLEYSIVNEKTLQGVWKHGMIYQIERDFVDLPKISISDFSIDFIRDKIGSGSEGDVFRVVYNDQECALKILRNAIASPNSSFKSSTSSSSSTGNNNSSGSLDLSPKHQIYRTRFTGRQHLMFTRSQKIWSKVSNHPFILDLYAWTGVGETSDNLKGYVTEICDLSLFDAIVRKTLSWKSMKRVLFNIAVGMEYLHSQSVMHRDLKSGNVLLDFQENPKICDFEYSRYDDFDYRKEVAMNISVLGTPGYLAPEILRGTAYTKSCDVFSFGILLYCCYFGDIDPYRNLKVCTGCKKDLRTSGLFIHQHVSRCGLRPLLVGVDEDRDPWIVKDLMVRCWEERPDERPTFHEIVKMFKDNVHKKKKKTNTDDNDDVVVITDDSVIIRDDIQSSINSDKNSSINSDSV